MKAKKRCRAFFDAIEAERAEITRDLTLCRLTFQYGEKRAATIIRGRDKATRADVALWRRVGAR